MVCQQTVKNKITFTGIGLHSGKETEVCLRPAEVGTGIVFHRIDLPRPVSIEALVCNVVNPRLSTTIDKHGASVATIEHLMAALFTCGIDNAHVDVTGPEVPILDGSAAPFVEAIHLAGVLTQSRPRRYLVVQKPVTIRDGEKRVTIIPSRHLRISCDLRFSHHAIRRQCRSVRFDPEYFADDFCPARTFGFIGEIEGLQKSGFALGASLVNAVALDETSVVNPQGLRFADEFVRHKILDTVGDLFLAGMPVIGHVKSCKAGHELNHQLLTELLSRRECWTVAEDRGGETIQPCPVVISEMAWLQAS